MKTLFMLLAFAVGAFAQACPGGFWGNGQCIGACESPLVNPNVSLSFYGYQCSAQPPCENNYVYCYPSYNAYDNAYQQFCGVIIDWNDGGCTPTAPLCLDRSAPRNRFNAALQFSARLSAPTEFKMRRPLIQNVEIKSRFWWKHASDRIRL